MSRHHICVIENGRQRLPGQWWLTVKRLDNTPLPHHSFMSSSRPWPANIEKNGRTAENVSVHQQRSGKACAVGGEGGYKLRGVFPIISSVNKFRRICLPHQQFLAIHPCIASTHHAVSKE